MALLPCFKKILRYPTAFRRACSRIRCCALSPSAERSPPPIPNPRGACLGGVRHDRKNMAMDIHELGSYRGFDSASVVGHGIGLMVADVSAAQPQGQFSA